MKIVVLDSDTLGADVDRSCFEAYGEVVSYPVTAPHETLERVRGADIVITNKVVIDREVMDGSDIRLICVAATGMNNIDLDYAREKGIAVKNVAGYSTPSVVQTTLAMVLHFMSDLDYFDRYAKRDDGWCRSRIFTHTQHPWHDLEDKTWGIIGLGAIGKRVARAAEALGANILYYSTSGSNRDDEFQRTTLEDLLYTCDIVSIHAPLNDKTYHLIDKRNLTELKSGAILLNLGRGGIIDEADLAAYIDESDIRVGLDVLEREPIAEDHPLRSVRAQDRLLLTPHIAWASVESRARLIEGICDNIKTYLGEVS